MNLYRLDREHRNGANLGPVSDLLGPRLIRAWSEARKVAVDTAAAQDCYVLVRRISGGGRVRTMGIATPSHGYSPTGNRRAGTLV